MSQGAYPISQFLFSLMEQLGLDRSGLVKSLGYKYLERGLNRFSPWLDHGEGHLRILKEIAGHYPERAAELQRALHATREQKTVESESAWVESLKAEASTFRSYVHVEGECTVPRGITLFALSGGKWNLIEIPDAILALPLEQQLDALPRLMRTYLTRYNGFCPFFGKVTGFRFVRLLDYYQFDQHGALVEHADRPFRRGCAALSLR
ncbi:MAG: hypothetical protein ABFD89_08035 [Bryobacteraceae bacterium]